MGVGVALLRSSGGEKKRGERGKKKKREKRRTRRVDRNFSSPTCPDTGQGKERWGKKSLQSPQKEGANWRRWLPISSKDGREEGLREGRCIWSDARKKKRKKNRGKRKKGKKKREIVRSARRRQKGERKKSEDRVMTAREKGGEEKKKKKEPIGAGAPVATRCTELILKFESKTMEKTKKKGPRGVRLCHREQGKKEKEERSGNFSLDPSTALSSPPQKEKMEGK